MGIISLLWGIVALLWMLVAFIPLLAWSGVFSLLFAAVGVIIAAFGILFTAAENHRRAKVGLLLNNLVILLGMARFALAGGLI